MDDFRQYRIKEGDFENLEKPAERISMQLL